MSDTSWTSGPWRVDAPDKVQNLEFIPVVTELGETVCDVCSFFTDDGVPLGITEQVRANARLIAAAPEMARVLGSIVQMHPITGGIAPMDLDFARVILTRIRGDAP